MGKPPKSIDLTDRDKNDWADRTSFNKAVNLIVGRTVTDIIDHFPTEDPGWSDHGAITIMFDDGSSLYCGAWGHDAWGPILDYTPAKL